MLPQVFDLFTQVDRDVDRAAGRPRHRPDAGQAAWSSMHGGSVEAHSDGLGPAAASSSCACRCWRRHAAPAGRSAQPELPRRRRGPTRPGGGRQPRRRRQPGHCCWRSWAGTTCASPTTAPEALRSSCPAYRPRRGAARHRHARHGRLRGGARAAGATRRRAAQAGGPHRLGQAEDRRRRRRPASTPTWSSRSTRPTCCS